MKKQKITEAEKIEKAIQEYEKFRPFPQYTTEWICNRIDWAWKWKKITKEQMEDFADRMCVILAYE